MGVNLSKPRKKTETPEFGPDDWPRKGTFLGVTQQDIVRVRLREYARRKWNVKLENTKDLQRLAVIKVMLNYDFTVEDIMKVLKKSQATIYRDMESVKMYEDGHKEFLNIYNNILSFVKYYNLEG